MIINIMQKEMLSYWQTTSTETPLETDLPSVIDVVVIGAGLLGAAVCYWLAREGITVALLERYSVNAGATGRNGGFVVAGLPGGYAPTSARVGHETASAFMTLMQENQILIRQIIQEEEIACDYREPGMLRLALSEEQLAHCQQEVQAQQADGLAASFLDHAQVQTLIKTPLSSDVLGGRFSPNHGLIHPARFVHGLVEAAQRRGARIYQAEVMSLAQKENQVLLHTSHGNLQARAVVVAVNAWTARLLPALSDKIFPAREQMLAYAPLPPVFTTGITVHMTTGEYMQQTPDGTIVIGGCSSVAPNMDLGIWEMTPTTIVQEAIERVVPRLFPELTPLKVVQRWAGLIDYTTDQYFIVDNAPGMSNVFFVGGFSGHGMPFGIRLGQMLAMSAMSESLPIALQPFRLERFTQKIGARAYDHLI